MTHPFAPMLLARKRILITGGGTGLGYAMSEAFVRAGADVIICGRRGDVLTAAVAALGAVRPGAVIKAQVCDIRDASSVDRMMDDIWADGALDVLVNNAAGNFIAQTDKLSARAADAILGVTLHGTLYCTLAAGRRWIESDRKGVILSILSTSVFTGRAFTVPSAMAKSGILAMTRSLAVEWGARGIRLVAIAPGSFPTEGAQSRLNPPHRLARATADTPEIPLGRSGRLDELSTLATFMVSSAADYMTGEVVVLDGGAHLRSSGAEDLLHWSDDDWNAHRAQLGKA